MKKKLTLDEIQLLLELGEFEDISIIRLVEQFLRRKRGYIFKMPKPRNPVILTVSGGLDSIISWGILMKEYRLKVYPVFYRRGQKRVKREEKSVDYFSKFYQQEFADVFEYPKKINAFIPPLEIRWPITDVSAQFVQPGSRQRRGIPLYSGLLMFYAIQYAYYLEIVKKMKIRTIFNGFVSSDSISFPYESLTALRAIMLATCVLTNDFSWQITSLNLEKELGFYFDKNTLIQWASFNNLPIEKTFSCINNYQFHCGVCDFCRYRKESFQKAGVKDKTRYLAK